MIEQALKRNLIVILNVHHYVEFMEDRGAHEPVTGSLETVVGSLQKCPRALFEVLNEPTNKVRQRYGTTCRTKPLS